MDVMNPCSPFWVFFWFFLQGVGFFCFCAGVSLTILIGGSRLI